MRMRMRKGGGVPGSHTMRSLEAQPEDEVPSSVAPVTGSAHEQLHQLAPSSVPHCTALKSAGLLESHALVCWITRRWFSQPFESIAIAQPE